MLTRTHNSRARAALGRACSLGRARARRRSCPNARLSVASEDRHRPPRDRHGLGLGPARPEERAHASIASASALSAQLGALSLRRGSLHTRIDSTR
eukprot:5393271-Pleurochrysis_carterae.AAC.4